MQIGMEEVKISLFAHDMIVYITYPQNSTREFIEVRTNGYVTKVSLQTQHNTH